MGGFQSAKEVKDKPVVLIIGGGFGGIEVAKLLDKDAAFNVVIIDRKNYFLHNMALLRAAVVDKWEQKCVIPYSKLLKYGSVVQGEVVSIAKDGKSVKVHGEEKEITCDYMVVGTGSSYAFPGKIAEVDSKKVAPKYEELRKVVAGATEITVIGGGAVGLELIGEIAHYAPEKKITLIHGGETLLNRTELSAKMKEKSLAAVQKFPNVKVLLGQRVDFKELGNQLKESPASFVAGKREITTSKGEKVSTDLVFMCTGAKLNTAAFKENLPTNEEGRIKVNEYLQIEGCDTAFAVGDCADYEPKFAYVAKFQAPTVNKNIRALEAKKKLTKHKKSPALTLLSLGPKCGTSQLPMGIVAGDFVTRTIKGDLFVKNTWADLNQNIAKPVETRDSAGRRKSMMSLEAAMKIDEERVKEIMETGLGKQKEVEKGQTNT
eukprot:CAMPEP_0114490508 /NCGR_PEP_ID=MMETSP0109-20121206/2481_1 /TAXON_ID=29199 /ORGANISM="Chlorarachnion reptans, Strain CCCM449" /LENGTH=432 /DNA_ID=CAMNT_0001667133 /DNA_START=161 /DNA_END=1459 /DNA_ORIENTATION=+